MLTAVRCIFGRIVHLQTALRCQWDKCRKNNLLFVSPSIRRPTVEQVIIGKSDDDRPLCHAQVIRALGRTAVRRNTCFVHRQIPFLKHAISGKFTESSES